MQERKKERKVMREKGRKLVCLVKEKKEVCVGSYIVAVAGLQL